MKGSCKSKPFDCVAFKCQAQARIYRRTMNLTTEEQINHFERCADGSKLGKWWQRIRSAKSTA
jgi:hypothetical protein